MTIFGTVALGLAIPLAGTTLGAAMVYFIRRDISVNLQKALLGFASGVMIAASVWSLLIPAIDMAKAAGALPWIPTTVGFLAGIAFLLLLDVIIPHLHLNTNQPEGVHSKANKSLMLMLAVTLHNLPEGMAVGVVFAGVVAGNAAVSVAGAFALSVGIAIQNFPEGAIISAPLMSAGLSRNKSFTAGFLSGVVEPIGAVLTLLLTSAIATALPYLLSFAAGAMIYVVVEELIPESQQEPHSNIGTIGTALGFALMMLLDVALG